jgi:hypothetical protein
MRLSWRSAFRPAGVELGVRPPCAAPLADWGSFVAAAAGAPLAGAPRGLYTRGGWSVTLALTRPAGGMQELHAFYAPFDEVIHARARFPAAAAEALLAPLAEHFLDAELVWEEGRVVALADL